MIYHVVEHLLVVRGGLEDAEVLEVREEREHDDREGDHHGTEHECEEDAAAGEADLGEAVGDEGGAEEGAGDAEEGDDERVAAEAGEFARSTRSPLSSRPLS